MDLEVKKPGEEYAGWKEPETGSPQGLEQGRQDLLAALENHQSGKVTEVRIKGQIPVSLEVGRFHGNFLSMLGSKLENAKVLDLFCGRNPVKRYVQENGLNTEVTGVDIDTPEADIRSDVAKLAEVISAEGQFDIVTSLGAHPGFENYQTSARYLKEGGLYITGGSEEVFTDCVLPVIANPEIQSSDEYSMETKKTLRVFEPMAIVHINDIKTDEKITMDECYVVFKKR